MGIITDPYRELEAADIPYSSAITDIGNAEEVISGNIQVLANASVPEEYIQALLEAYGTVFLEDSEFVMSVAAYYANTHCDLDMIFRVAQAMTDSSRNLVDGEDRTNYEGGLMLCHTLHIHQNDLELFTQVVDLITKMRQVANILHSRYQRVGADADYKKMRDVLMAPIDTVFEASPDLITNMDQLREFCALLISVFKSTGGQVAIDKICRGAISFRVLKYYLELCLHVNYPWSELFQITHGIKPSSLENVSDEDLRASFTVANLSNAPDELPAFLVSKGAEKKDW